MSIFAEKLDDYFVRCLAYFNYRDYVNRMKLRGDEKVLEVGSGGGNLSRFLAKRLSKGKLICIDNSAYWINKTRNRLKGYKNIGFKIEDILNIEITITGYDVRKSKYEKNESGKVLTVEFEKDHIKRIFFTGSEVLISQLEKYADNIPFLTTIKKINKFYTLT